MSKTTFASDTNVSHKTTLPKELEIILKEFQEEFSWNKAPVRLNDDNGNAITPEPLIYEQVDFLNNRLKNLVAQAEERVKQLYRAEIIDKLDKLPTYGLDVNIHLDSAIDVVNEVSKSKISDQDIVERVKQQVVEMIKLEMDGAEELQENIRIYNGDETTDCKICGCDPVRQREYLIEKVSSL